MITEYHRPLLIQEALRLLTRPGIVTYPLAGGTVINQFSPEPIAVVDLQALGLDTIQTNGKTLEIGATVTLQLLLEHDQIPQALDIALRQETNINLRQMASIAGTLITVDGRSALATMMLALDAQMTLEPGAERISLGEFMLSCRQRLPGKLVTLISIPLNIRASFEYIARSPADLPIICAAVVQWPSGRTRVVIGGWGSVPVLAMDGPESAGAEIAAKEVCSDSGDVWASADYRQEMAAVLTSRCVGQIDERE